MRLLAPNTLGDRSSRDGGSVDTIDPETGIGGWVSGLDAASGPVRVVLMVADHILAESIVDRSDEDGTGRARADARSAFRLSRASLLPGALGVLRTAADDAPVSVLIADSGEDLPWAVPRPSAGALARLLGSRPAGAPPPVAHSAADPPDRSLRPGQGTGISRPKAAGEPSVPADAPSPRGSEDRPAGREPPFHLVAAGDGSQPSLALGIDRVVDVAGSMLLAGWIIGASDLCFGEGEGEDVAPDELIWRSRSDIGRGFGVPDDLAHGFVAIWKASPGPGPLRIASEGSPGLRTGVTLPTRSPPDAVRSFLLEQSDRLAIFIRIFGRDPAWMAAVMAVIGDAPPQQPYARGFIEQARSVPGLGGLAVGWSVSLPDWQVMAVDEGGATCALDEAPRWNRLDVRTSLDSEFGPFCLNAGFAARLAGRGAIGSRLCLVASGPETAFVIARTQWTAAPLEPGSLAKWAFSLPVPGCEQRRFIETHVGGLLDALVSRKAAALRAITAGRHAFGEPVADPLCTLIIPLFGSTVFMANQCIELAADPFVRSRVEVLYVVDDPSLVDEALSEARRQEELTGLPMTVVDARVNRGFSGANNLGSRHARAPFLLFLNSDVIPLAPGWVEAMMAACRSAPDVGAVGARLLYPEGGIQHDGLAFSWDASLGAHLNTHPGSGLLPRSASSRATERVAVTGACLLIRKAVHDAVGGFDEEFLIGDFEDSDLCLKVRASGRRILCVEDVDLVHLERQSFGGIGSPQFRQGVVHYNLYRHERRWGEQIARSTGRGPAVR